MIKQHFDISGLIARYLAGTLTPEEEARLNEWRETSLTHEELFQKICNSKNFELYCAERKNYDPKEGWEQFDKKIKFIKRKNYLIKASKYAAVFLLPLFIGILVLTNLIPDEKTVAEQMSEQSIIIPPGEKKATLTLASGETMHLKEASETIVQEVDGTAISVDSITLNYNLAQKKVNARKEIYNKIDVPHGGEYSLVLSDGTKVYLNSMSSLKFPVHFVGNERIVELKGEAYFEVSKDTKPFIVKVDGIEVRALGTAFNISSYQEQGHQTTLVNGAVKVTTHDGSNCILNPSEQAYFKPDSNQIHVRKVDVMEHISWINGKIYFKDARLEDIMNTLSRWYDIDVFYLEPGIKNIRFGCNVNRYKDITPFLELLEKTEKLDILIKDKTITFKHND